MFRTLAGLIGPRDGPPRVALRESPPEHPGVVLTDCVDADRYSHIPLSNPYIRSTATTTRRRGPCMPLKGVAWMSAVLLGPVMRQTWLGRRPAPKT